MIWRIGKLVKNPINPPYHEVCSMVDKREDLIWREDSDPSMADKSDEKGSELSTVDAQLHLPILFVFFNNIFKFLKKCYRQIGGIKV